MWRERKQAKRGTNRKKSRLGYEIKDKRGAQEN
jgi:hypothetical protein